MIIIRRLITLTLAIIFVIWGFNIIKNQKTGGVVKAFGPLKVTFPSEPMFSDLNLFPGKNITRSVTIENTDNKAYDIAIKTNNFSSQNISSLSNVIDIEITRDGMPIYGINSSTGRKTLADFSSADLVSLKKLLPGENSIYDFVIQLNSDAGDEFQGQVITFDLLVGIDTLSFVTMPTIAAFPTLRQNPTFPKYPTLRPMRRM